LFKRSRAKSHRPQTGKKKEAAMKDVQALRVQVPIPISAGDVAAIAASAQKSVPDPVAGTAMTKELCPHATDRISTLKRNQWYQIQAVAAATELAIAAIGFYRVRELVAALIIFSFLFGIVGIAFLTLFLIQELALKRVIQVVARLACVRPRHAAVSSQRNSDCALGSPR
jgi:hypothetical protein